MSKDNHGTAVGLANLDRIIGLPITFNIRSAGHIPAGTAGDVECKRAGDGNIQRGRHNGTSDPTATVDQGLPWR